MTKESSRRLKKKKKNQRKIELIYFFEGRTKVSLGLTSAADIRQFRPDQHKRRGYSNTMIMSSTYFCHHSFSLISPFVFIQFGPFFRPFFSPPFSLLNHLRHFSKGFLPFSRGGASKSLIFSLIH